VHATDAPTLTSAIRRICLEKTAVRDALELTLAVERLDLEGAVPVGKHRGDLECAVVFVQNVHERDERNRQSASRLRGGK